MESLPVPGIESWQQKLCWMAFGVILGNLPRFCHWMARRMHLMPKPAIDRVWIMRGARDEDQWVKTRVRLRRWLILGNDACLNCSIRASREPDGGTPVPLFAAGVPDPLPTFSLGPGDQCEVLVAIWLPRADEVRISRSLAFRLTGKEPRFLSHSLGYGLIDTTPILPDGRQFIRLEITQQGRVD